LQQVERAKNVGHLMRHEGPFSLAMLWEPAGTKKSPLTISEICAKDLHVNVDMLEELAINREQWYKRIDDFKLELEQRRMYVPVWSTRWRAACRTATSLHDLQFVEEGNAPFPWFGTELHGYSDGSALKDGERRATGFAAIPVGKELPPSIKPVCAPLLRDVDQTNNRAEIMGAMATVRQAIFLGRVAVMHTDSGVVWYWYHYQRQSLRLVKYRSLENADLWLEFDELLHKCVEHYCIKVRAHNGNRWNDEADLAAGLAARNSSFFRYPGQPLLEGPVHEALLPLDRSLEVLGRKRPLHSKKQAYLKQKKHEAPPLDWREEENLVEFAQRTVGIARSTPTPPRIPPPPPPQPPLDEIFTLGKAPLRRSKRTAALEGLRHLVTWHEQPS